MLFNKSQLITAFTRAGCSSLLHFTKLHFINIRVILILYSQLLLCLVSVSSIKIYPPHPYLPCVSSSVQYQPLRYRHSEQAPAVRMSRPYVTCCCLGLNILHSLLLSKTIFTTLPSFDRQNFIQSHSQICAFV